MIDKTLSGAIMNQETVTVELSDEKRRVLDTIATETQRDRAEVISEAIDVYLETYTWQIAEIQQGLVEAEAGDFATEADVQAAFRKLTCAS
jgi:predicted transcriptional regulator